MLLCKRRVVVTAGESGPVTGPNVDETVPWDPFDSLSAKKCRGNRMIVGLLGEFPVETKTFYTVKKSINYCVTP